MHKTRAPGLEKDQQTSMTIPQKHLIFKDKWVYLQIRNKAPGKPAIQNSHMEGKTVCPEWYLNDNSIQVEFKLEAMMDSMYKPDLSPEKIREDLFHMVTPGEIHDREMNGRIKRLRERFEVYATTFPLGLWAPGLAMTGEMRALTDVYLPMAEIRREFSRFFRLSLSNCPLSDASPFHRTATWTDALQMLQPNITNPDPAALLQRLMVDESFRIDFLFSIFLPNRHGGGFHRYPAQTEFLQVWLKERNPGGRDNLRCLDTACATGESTYELALLLLEQGLEPDSFLIHGSTIEQLELFAAAHIFFPHDPKRQALFRKSAEPVFLSGANGRMAFFTEDITHPQNIPCEGYDIILCNGLLGGPRFSKERDIETVVAELHKRLRSGGIILVADRFHGGWKKRMPTASLQRILRNHGFRIRDVAEGLAAEKTKDD
jgi:chemotaxis methyl-accepting protein methylase